MRFVWTSEQTAFISLYNINLLVFIIETESVYCAVQLMLNFRHRESSLLGLAFHYSSENAFYIFNQQIYFII
jgi:hypothetical protein